jgi:hypothetical protein
MLGDGCSVSWACSRHQCAPGEARIEVAQRTSLHRAYSCNIQYRAFRGLQSPGSSYPNPRDQRIVTSLNSSRHARRNADGDAGEWHKVVQVFRLPVEVILLRFFYSLSGRRVELFLFLW